MKHIQPVVDMFEMHNQQYQKAGDYSVTTLLNPPRIVHLERRHEKREPILKRDFASFVGTAVHKYAEDMLRLKGGYLLERRMKMLVDERVISGTFDISQDDAIWDIKTCKTWKLVYEPEMEDWHQQQNIYAYMMGAEGVTIKELNIIAMYLDWIETKADRDPGYPQEPVLKYQLDVWPVLQTRDFLHERVALMKQHEETPDDDLPVCTPKERWEDAPVFAAWKKEGAARAGRLLNTLEDAINYMKTTSGYGMGSYIEVRPGIRKRCERYCNIRQHCNYYQTFPSNDARREVIPYEQV